MPLAGLTSVRSNWSNRGYILDPNKPAAVITSITPMSLHASTILERSERSRLHGAGAELGTFIGAGRWGTALPARGRCVFGRPRPQAVAASRSVKSAGSEAHGRPQTRR